MSFDTTNTTRREESLIPNTQIESMFMSVCEDSEMEKYVELCDNGHISLATAYASNKVYKVFYQFIDMYGVPQTRTIKFKKGKKK